MSPSITCPAVILAQRRRTSVKGRMRVEMISIQNKTNPNPTGAPVGTKWVKKEIFPREKKMDNLTINNEILKRILNQPCLLLAKAKGINPLKLIDKSERNKVLTKIEILEILLFKLLSLQNQTKPFQE